MGDEACGARDHEESVHDIKGEAEFCEYCSHCAIDIDGEFLTIFLKGAFYGLRGLYVVACGSCVLSGLEESFGSWVGGVDSVAEAGHSFIL